MKQINLIPATVRAREGREKLIFGLTVSTVIAIGLVLLAHITIQSQLEAADLQINQIKTGQSRSASKVVVAGADLTARTAKINAIAPTELNWNKAFAFVGAVLPADIVLSNYSYATANGLITLKLSGMAPSNVSFASFAQTLAADKKRLASSKVDSYVFDPVKGTVTFTVTLVVSPAQLTFVGK
jgi:hypothetical protein